MIRKILITLLFFSGMSIAIDKPNSQKLYNEGSDKSYITFNCSEVKNDDSILCEFSQSTLSYKLNPNELMNKINEMKKKLDSEDLTHLTVGDMKKQICNEKVKSVNKKIEVNAINGGYIKGYSKKLNDIILKSCNLKTKNEMISLMNDMFVLTTEKDATTCLVSSQNWSEIFFPKINSDNSYWLAQSEGSGECGIINISTLKKDGDYYWKYQSKRIVTNKSGEGINSCDKYEERDITYSNNQKEYDISCKIFKFGF